MKKIEGAKKILFLLGPEEIKTIEFLSKTTNKKKNEVVREVLNNIYKNNKSIIENSDDKNSF